MMEEHIMDVSITDLGWTQLAVVQHAKKKTTVNVNDAITSIVTNILGIVCATNEMRLIMRKSTDR